MDTFVHFEVEGYKRLLEKVQSDMGVVQRASKGEAVPPQTLQGVIQGLNYDQVPKAWLSLTFPSCICLTQWIKDLPTKLQTISSYVLERPGVYNVASFLRPDRFFEAVKHQYARKHFKEVDSIHLEIQVRKYCFIIHKYIVICYNCLTAWPQYFYLFKKENWIWCFSFQFFKIFILVYKCSME